MSERFDSDFGSKDKRKATCPECNREVRVSTLFEKKQSGWNDVTMYGWEIQFYVFQCNGCETIFFARASSNSEDYVSGFDENGRPEQVYLVNRTYFPTKPSTPTPSWAGFKLANADSVLHDLVSSIYVAMNNDMEILAAIGMRTAFDRISELLDIKPNLSFADKLEEMRKQGSISGVQKGILEVLIDAGGAAAHRGWKPDKRNLETMLEILEALIRDHFILKPEVEKLKATIPKKFVPQKPV